MVLIALITCLLIGVFLDEQITIRKHTFVAGEIGCILFFAFIMGWGLMIGHRFCFSFNGKLFCQDLSEHYKLDEQ